jgi:hypothetical protein
VLVIRIHDEPSGEQALDDLVRAPPRKVVGSGSMLPSRRPAAALRMAIWVSVSLAFMVMLLLAIDDATMNALFSREAKLFLPGGREETARKTHNLGNMCIFINM